MRLRKSLSEGLSRSRYAVDSAPDGNSDVFFNWESSMKPQRCPNTT